MNNIIDTIIVGGGPSGLSAALILGRCNRKVLVFDDGNYRNAKTQHVNGFLTQDGIIPDKLRELARKDLEKYDVKIINSHVENITKEDNYFIVHYDAYTVKTKSIILATGLIDQLPDIPGLNNSYGEKIHICIYCDAHQYKDKKIGVHGSNGIELAIMLRTWSKDIIWFAEKEPSDEEKEILRNKNIKVVWEKIGKIHSYSNGLGIYTYSHNSKTYNEKSSFVDGLFLSLIKGQKQRSKLAEKLGLKVTKENGVEVDEKCATEIKGIYCVGDATRDRYLVVKGAAEGAEAAISVNTYLRENWDD